MRKSLFCLLLALPALLLALASCDSPGADEAQPIRAQSSEGVRFVEAAAAEVEGLPDYAYRSAEAIRGYQIAVRERELLARLPCYCGCGQEERYKNLRDCFLDEQGAFNSHGANCRVCLVETEDAARWKARGLSVKEVRARIEASYEGRGKPTDTPPVED